MNQFWGNWVNSNNPGEVVFSSRGLFYDHIFRLHGVPQEPEWHPEGCVARHTMFVVNAAAAIAQREALVGEQKIVLMFAALGHDFAKPDTTEVKVRNGVSRITAEGHEKAGGPLVRDFMQAVGVEAHVIDQVVPLVENHMVHIDFNNHKPTNRVLRRLRQRLLPSNAQMLAWLVEADVSGRPPLPQGMPQSAKDMVEQINALSPDEEKAPTGILQGRHLIEMGVKPGPEMGAILKAVAQMEFEGQVVDLDGALNAAKGMIKVT